MNYKDLAKEILQEVGGESNIQSMTHCATRLRFNLKDNTSVDAEAVKKIAGVYGAVNKGGQFQVIIGNDVPYVYTELESMVSLGGGKKEEKKKKFSLSAVFDVIAGIFVPLIPAIAGCGLLKAVLSLLTTFGVLSTDTQTYYIISMVSDTAFYFLPMLLAFTSAKKFNCSPFLAVVMAGMLLHPNFTALVSAGEAVNFLGLPVQLVNYGSSVVPIILIVWALSYVQRFFERIMPKAVRVILVPLCSVLVMIPLALVVIGPLGSFVGNYLAELIIFLEAKIPWLVPMVIGGLTPLLVMTGMHYSLFPPVLTQLSTQSFNTVSIGFFPSNMAQAAATLAVSLKTKDKELKQLAASAGITALCGITEPALYGVTMKLKKPLWAVLIGGGLGGLYYGLTGVRAFTPLPGNPLQIAGYINGEAPMNLINAVIGVAIAMAAAFILTWIFGVDNKKTETKSGEEKTEPLMKKVSVCSPMEGKCVPLSQVEDETFSSEVMGKGIAIVPSEGKVYAPFDGSVKTVFHTKHAIGLESEDGVELLIHLGLDTVELDGEYFVSHVENGEKIKKNQLLLEFDIDKIKEKGYQTVSPIIVTNTSQYLDVLETENGTVKAGDTILTIL